MKTDFSAELAAALISSQGVTPTPEGPAEDAKWAKAVLERAAGAFARLAFEAEPSGFTAAQRRAAP